MNASRTTAKKPRVYNFGCKPVSLSVQFVQPLPELDLQPDEATSRFWPNRW
jgi:hypothetical protein